MSDDYRLDELASAAGVTSTTVRLYRTKGLLQAPRLEGRVGWFNDTHLTRLRLIARLQSEGHSLAGIGGLLEQWEQGRSLDSVIGVEAGLEALTGQAHAIELDPLELLARFPDGVMTPDAMQRASSLGLVELTTDGTIRVPDRRFLESGASLMRLGVPVAVVLDEWEALVDLTDAMAARFVAVFETHIAPADWEDGLDDETTQALASSLVQLQKSAREVVLSALDASVARLGRERLATLIDRPHSE